jgi:DNA-binding NtrC family response regulator
MQAFTRYDWPGNVRELENTCERIAQTCTCGTVHVGCVAAQILFRAGKPVPEALPPAAPSPTAPVAVISLDDRLRELESTLIAWALKMSNGNKSRAAELLQIKRSTLGDRIRHCGLDRVTSPPVSGAAGVPDGVAAGNDTREARAAVS